MRDPWVTLSPQVQKVRVEEIHHSTPIGKDGHNDSHTAASSANTSEIYKRRELANITKPFRKLGKLIMCYLDYL